MFLFCIWRHRFLNAFVSRHRSLKLSCLETGSLMRLLGGVSINMHRHRCLNMYLNVFNIYIYRHRFLNPFVSRHRCLKVNLRRFN